MTDNHAIISFEDPEHPVSKGEQPAADFTTISPEYFNAMQVPLLEGRDFTERDDVKAPQVVIVNQAFAQTFFPGQLAIGKKIKPGEGSGEPPLREIVGVVEIYGFLRPSVC